MSDTLCYLGLGGNLGNPGQLFDQVIENLRKDPRVSGLRESPRYESTPIEATGPNYLNSVIELLWQADALALLTCCLNVEHQHGRVRGARNAPRLIDLDVLLFGTQTIQSDELTVPHPRMHTRRFVLEPLLALNDQLAIPGLGLVRELLPQTLGQSIRRI